VRQNSPVTKGLDLPGDELSLAEPDDGGLIEIVARLRIGVAYAGA
jgi:hypothetical protein